jgi:hypothetical protein
MFALHMFDALIECDASFTYHLADGSSVVEHRNETTKMSHRSRCDPIIYYELARRACSRVGGRIAVVRVANAAPVLDLDVRLRARRSSRPSFVDVIDIRDFCTNTPRYSFWRHNDWIAPE